MSEYTADPSLDQHLLNDYQRDFPLCSAPFAELASALGVIESTVLRRLDCLRREGRIARVGAVFAPKRIGASTLVAIAVPEGDLAAVAERVNRFPEVNQNYTRAHRYNFWFVVTAGSESRLQAALAAIETTAGYPLLCLPLLREFPALPAVQAGGNWSGLTALDEIGRRLVMALQEGLPFFIRPFSVLASRVGCDEDEVIERIRRWRSDGVIKRFGVVVRHPESAVATSALFVQDIPDNEVAAHAGVLAHEPGISLCYERQRHLPEWPYNLFCAIEGVGRAGVLERIAGLRERLGLSAYSWEVLFAEPSQAAAGG